MPSKSLKTRKIYQEHYSSPKKIKTLTTDWLKWYMRNTWRLMNIWRLIQYGLFPQTECWYVQFILLAFFSLVFNQEIEWVAYGKKWSVLHVLFWDISSVQSLSHVWLFATPWTAACQASLSITNSRSLLKLMSIESMMLSNHLIFCHPLLLPSILPSIRVFCSESVLCISWPKYWSFSFSISPSNEYSGLISFKIDWFDLLAVQGTLKSLLQHQSSKASILRYSAFFIVQLSHPYMTTGKTITWLCGPLLTK